MTLLWWGQGRREQWLHPAYQKYAIGLFCWLRLVAMRRKLVTCQVTELWLFQPLSTISQPIYQESQKCYSILIDLTLF